MSTVTYYFLNPLYSNVCIQSSIQKKKKKKKKSDCFIKFNLILIVLASRPSGLCLTSSLCHFSGYFNIYLCLCFCSCVFVVVDVSGVCVLIYIYQDNHIYMLNG